MCKMMVCCQGIPSSWEEKNAFMFMISSLKDLQENVGALPAESMMQFLCV